MENLPYWRTIYKSLKGNCKYVCLKHVSRVLDTVGENLIDGLQLYKPYTSESYLKWKSIIKIKDDNHNLETFMKKVAIVLNLDCSTAYGLFCNYLMYDYYGKIDDVILVTQIDIYKNAMLEKIWTFYTLERMFLLKCLQGIVENYNDTKHPYHEEFRKFINKHTVQKIVSSLLLQYKDLLYEINVRNKDHCLSLKEWVHRNNAEQLQILFVFIYCANMEAVRFDSFLKLIELFDDHGFGYKPPSYYEATAFFDKQDFINIIHLEYATYLVTIRKYWDTNRFTKEEDFSKLFKSIVQMTEEHSVLLYGLILLIPKLPESFKANYLQYITEMQYKCFNNTVFVIVCSIINKPYFKGTKLELILKETAWSMMSVFCQNTDDMFYVYEKTGSVELLASILELPGFCERIVIPEEPLFHLFALALNLFPYNYSIFTLLCRSLLKHGQFVKEISNLIFHFNTYTEEAPCTLDIPTLLVSASQEPIPGLKIPSHSVAKVANTPDGVTLLQFNKKLNYSYLLFLKTYMSYMATHHIQSMHLALINLKLLEYTEKAKDGLGLLAELIKYDKTVFENEGFQQIINHALYIVATADPNKKYENIKLVDVSFRTIVSVMTTFKFNIMQNLVTSYSLPTIPANYLTVEKLFKANFINDSSLLQFMVLQRHAGHHEILYSYFDFAVDCLMNHYDHQRYTVPAVVFFTLHIFPSHLNWEYSSLFEKNGLSLKLVTFIFSILQMNDERQHEMLTLCFNFCKETVFNHDAFCKAFIALVRLSNSYLEKLMLRNINWECGQVNDMIMMVRTCLSIILWMFNIMEWKDFKKTRFWNFFFYTGANFSSIIKVLSEYVNHKFDSVLPRLACKLLKRIAMDSSIPVLASLEMDTYQVQWMFLERLRDPIEDDEVKIGLLELITTCVKKQNGMTAAFFNLTPHKAVPVDQEETLIGYMHEYLKNIDKSPEYLKSPLQAALLELFQTIWAEKKKFLVKDLIRIDIFWKTIVVPLRQDFKLPITTYSQVLDILAIEVFNVNIDDNLKEQLRDVIFSADSKLPENISRYISDTVNENPKDPVSINLLYTWKKLLTFVVKHHDYLLSAKAKLEITKYTLQGLLHHCRDAMDIRIIVYWSSLYLYLISKWNNDAYNGKELLDTYVQAMNYIERRYQELDRKCKETILTIAIKTFEHFDHIVDENSQEIQRFLAIMMKITEKEYQALSRYRSSSGINYIDYAAWFLVITFANRLLKHSVHDKWFFYTQFMEKVTSTIGFFMSSPVTMPNAKISLQFLISYLDSTLYKEFMNLDYQMFYDSIKPPMELLNYEMRTVELGTAVDFREFWLAYASLIYFNIKLLLKFEYFMFLPLLEFLAMHKTEIVSILRLPQATVDANAMKLVSNTLRLFKCLSRWKNVWRAVDENLYTGYYKMTSECFNSCVSLMLRPHIIKICTRGENDKLVLVDRVFVNFISTIMDSVVEVITSAASALLAISPNLVDLLGQSYKNIPYFGIFDYSFHIPNPDNPTELQERLSFGGVFCLLQHLCKALIQILFAKKEQTIISTSTYNIDIEDVFRPLDPSSYITVVNQNIQENEPQDIFSNIIPHYVTPQIHSLSAPWLAHMNKNGIIYALEILNTLLASQIFKALVESSMDAKKIKVLRHELCSELQFYHEFIRKKLLDPHKYVLMDGNLVMKSANYTRKLPSDGISENVEYMLMLSHWYINVCQLNP